MMLPTHALAGMVVALPVAIIMPEIANSVLIAGFVGGIVPDLDMYAGHRKTLHYPVYYSILAGLGVGLAVAFPTVMTISGAVFVLGAALHCVSDLLGGGLELRPWEATSDRAVFSHYHSRWLSPRRWVGYDGSPIDLLVTVVLSVPLLATLGNELRWIVSLAVVVAISYTLVRRLLPTVADRLVNDVLVVVLPEHVLTYLPSRYREHHSATRIQ